MACSEKKIICRLVDSPCNLKGMCAQLEESVTQIKILSLYSLIYYY